MCLIYAILIIFRALYHNGTFLRERDSIACLALRGRVPLRAVVSRGHLPVSPVFKLLPEHVDVYHTPNGDFMQVDSSFYCRYSVYVTKLVACYMYGCRSRGWWISRPDSPSHLSARCRRLSMRSTLLRCLCSWWASATALSPTPLTTVGTAIV